MVLKIRITFYSILFYSILFYSISAEKKSDENRTKAGTPYWAEAANSTSYYSSYMHSSYLRVHLLRSDERALVSSPRFDHFIARWLRFLWFL
jgi:hypothetical protein